MTGVCIREKQKEIRHIEEKSTRRLSQSLELCSLKPRNNWNCPKLEERGKGSSLEPSEEYGSAETLI